MFKTGDRVIPICSPTSGKPFLPNSRSAKEYKGKIFTVILNRYHYKLAEDPHNFGWAEGWLKLASRLPNSKSRPQQLINSFCFSQGKR